MNSSYFESNKPQSFDELSFMHPEYYALPPANGEKIKHSVTGWYDLQRQLESMIASEKN